MQYKLTGYLSIGKQREVNIRFKETTITICIEQLSIAYLHIINKYKYFKIKHYE